MPSSGHPAVRPTPAGTGWNDPAIRKKWIRAGIAVLILEAVALAIGLRVLGTFHSTELDVTTAQSAVAQILADPITGYGATDVTAVTCNNGQNPPVKKGHTFTCKVTINGRQRQVNVVFRDDNGTYEVDRPR